MKNTLKKLLPQPVINTLRALRDDAGLNGMPPGDFPTGALRGTFALTPFLTAPAIVASWERDHAAIRALFGQDDKWGGINPGDRRALYSLITTLRPARVLEVGTHIGASTLYIARALNAQGRVTTVDILDVNAPDAPWKTLGLPLSPRAMAEKLDCADRIAFVAQPAQDFMRATDERFDLIFLDGDHSARAVYGEVAAALTVLRPGGVILLHDYYPGGKALFADGSAIPGPFRALERIMRENLAMGVQPLGALPWPTKQGSHMTSLALLTKKS